MPREHDPENKGQSPCQEPENQQRPCLLCDSAASPCDPVCLVGVESRVLTVPKLTGHYQRPPSAFRDGGGQGRWQAGNTTQLPPLHAPRGVGRTRLSPHPFSGLHPSRANRLNTRLTSRPTSRGFFPALGLRCVVHSEFSP